jgi:Ala-tRNA(Pro) deacylase
MPIAHTVQMYLSQHHVPFDLVPHRHTASSLRSADTAHIHASRLAKAVLLEDDFEHSHFSMAVVPASRRVELAAISRQAGRKLHLATEEDAAGLFEDCEAGAIPALGPAYGLETMLDDSLLEEPELYFEAGDHEHLVRLQRRDLERLLADCAHGSFSRPIQPR